MPKDKVEAYKKNDPKFFEFLVKSNLYKPAATQGSQPSEVTETPADDSE